MFDKLISGSGKLLQSSKTFHIEMLSDFPFQWVQMNKNTLHFSFQCFTKSCLIVENTGIFKRIIIYKCWGLQNAWGSYFVEIFFCRTISRVKIFHELENNWYLHKVKMARTFLNNLLSNVIRSPFAFGKSPISRDQVETHFIKNTDFQLNVDLNKTHFLWI